MPPPPPSPSSPPAFKLLALLLSSALAFYLLWPFLPSPFSYSSHSSICTPCTCDCISDSVSMLLPGVVNTPSLDCGRVDPVLREDLDKTSLELLSEELKLQESVAEETQRHADSALLDVKKLASQYQKEAEKCNSGMETCEEAREKSEAALIAQKKISVLWEKRARELGWRDKADHQSIFSRIGLGAVTGNDGQSNSFFKSQK